MMIRNLCHAFVFGATLTAALPALADNAPSPGTQNPGQAPDGTWGTGRTLITLPDLRAQCQSYDASSQIKPQQVTVNCREHRFEWRYCASSFQLQNQRTIYGGIGVKYFWTDHAYQWNEATAGACGTYARYEVGTRTSSVKMMCDELLNTIKTEQDLDAYCVKNLGDAVGKDPDMQDAGTPTGDVINTCSGTAVKTAEGYPSGNPCVPGPGNSPTPLPGQQKPDGSGGQQAGGTH